MRGVKWIFGVIGVVRYYVFFNGVVVVLDGIKYLFGRCCWLGLWRWFVVVEEILYLY